MKCLQVILVASIGVILASSEQDKRLIRTSADEDPKWMSEEEIWTLIRNRKNFMDVTDHPDMPTRVQSQDVNTTVIPTEIRYEQTTRAALDNIDIDHVNNFVKQFSNYHNRYYKAKTGIDSQKWLLSEVESSLKGYNGNTAVEEFKHDWPQSSIIARIEGSDPILKDEVLILGAHQDSINIFSARFKAPGADDNASGSSTVLEAMRVIVNSKLALKRTVEFHWYAAEEVGLRGSAAIAKQYKQNGVNVVGMVNFDVVGYEDPKDPKVIGIYTDNAHPAMVDFLRLLADTFLAYKHQEETCGYGCSDHASWTGYGYPAAMPAEATMHPMMHTGYDDHQRVSFGQVHEFIKLASAFLVEFGEPIESLV